MKIFRQNEFARLSLTKADELDDELVEIMFSKGAAVIDVLVPEEENVLPMVPGGKRLDQMVLGK